MPTAESAGGRCGLADVENSPAGQQAGPSAWLPPSSQGQAGLREVGSLGAGQALLVHGPLVSAFAVWLPLFALPARVFPALPTLATFTQ